MNCVSETEHNSKQRCTETLTSSPQKLAFNLLTCQFFAHKKVKELHLRVAKPRQFNSQVPQNEKYEKRRQKRLDLRAQFPPTRSSVWARARRDSF